MKPIQVCALLLVFGAVSARLLLPRDVKQSKRGDGLVLDDAELDFTQVTKGFNNGGGVEFISGYAPVTATSQSALYWLFYPAKYSDEKNVTKVPLVIWLQGGPGSSSMLGNFLELGPKSLVRDQASGKVSETPRAQAWSDMYNLLIIDQPIGVGYSIWQETEALPKNQNEVAVQLYHALVQIFTNGLRDYAKTDLYIFGESYAGKYVPTIAQYILQHSGPDDHQFPLKALGVGDGFTDPVNLLSEFGLFGFSFGLINEVERKAVELAQLRGVTQISKGLMLEARQSFSDVLDPIRDGGGNVNHYNFRIFGDYEKEQKLVEDYLNQEDAKAKYGAKGSFVVSNEDVFEALGKDFMDTAVNAMIFCVERLPVLIYNGQDDVIVNTPSVLNYLSRMDWASRDKFNKQEFTQWTIDKKPVGQVKAVDNLTFVVVNKAGHLVPMDQMAASWDMLDRFITNGKKWDN